MALQTLRSSGQANTADAAIGTIRRLPRGHAVRRP